MAAGVSLRWTVNITAWEWRGLLPLSAALSWPAFSCPFSPSGQSRAGTGDRSTPKKDGGMIVVIGSTIAFLATLLVNFGGAVYLSIYSTHRPYPGSTNDFWYF